MWCSLPWLLMKPPKMFSTELQGQVDAWSHMFSSRVQRSASLARSRSTTSPCSRGFGHNGECLSGGEGPQLTLQTRQDSHPHTRDVSPRAQCSAPGLCKQALVGSSAVLTKGFGVKNAVILCRKERFFLCHVLPVRQSRRVSVTLLILTLSLRGSQRTTNSCLAVSKPWLVPFQLLGWLLSSETLSPSFHREEGR